ncbi:Kelch repeat-containing protein [Arenicella xantha]|uniref:N-acetylneuraminic acid mutarotase n=1 Tax=Arenicella xantha TaxID=644221 RepID=A0A395JRK6_9GAMM|nr:DUF5060 domain-containing protein [Arenicella xantha]RBP53195.1 N-acetylneuraminic acid mutarotase [Arenicella xantha]
MSRKSFTWQVGRILLLAPLLLGLFACQPDEPWQWESVTVIGQPTARHEASMVAHNGKIYLLGGRRINPVDVFDPQTNEWVAKASTPIELHHFQAVSLGDAIYIVGAMTGQYPNETPLDKVIAYYPASNTFKYLHEIPVERRRGGAGVAVHNGKLYVVGGITNGHVDGYKPWLDEYDPVSGEWRVLPDAQFARDHVQAAINNDKLYVFAGRTSRQRTDEVMSLLVEHGEVFDLNAEQWLPVTNQLALPHLRAGNMLMFWNNEIIIGGGESHLQESAHREVDAFDTKTQQWRRWPDLLEGRHGTGFVVLNDYVYTASGSANRGGGPELTSMERLKLPLALDSGASNKGELPVTIDETPVYQLWHTVELDFVGPDTSESDVDNPFLNKRLDVEFTHALSQKTIRGFYAADGNAAETSADSGAIWRVRFTPHIKGKWTYRASLRSGENIAIQELSDSMTVLPLESSVGEFLVVGSDKDQSDFRAHGHLAVDRSYFRFRDTGEYWIKAGANSPENLLGYFEFDGTYRVGRADRDGDAVAGEGLHQFKPHAADWQLGDPSWQEGKGKNLIGAMNYLAAKGMNASYFLTMNINGDGNDVWPYVKHDELSRFDVSKLAQWEILFEHMQSKGILLHIVTQETENERLLDDGDVGPQRQLYLNEMIARFAHHPGLIWNLGEENGPAEWSPVAQSDDQRLAMSTYIKAHDPYQHPVLLHTHSTPDDKDRILPPQLGHADLDGLSFQVHLREQVYDELVRWRQRSREAGHEWLITMDEIGEWHTAALPDSLDPNHDTLRRYALWGSLMAGGAGVEWYFGAKYPANDLTSEDWRLRDRLWTITDHARGFFQRHVPFWAMQATPNLTSVEGAYMFAKQGDVYLLYSPVANDLKLDLTSVTGEFAVHWFDPLNGDDLQVSDVKTVQGGRLRYLGQPPSDASRDWVVLLRRLVSTHEE